MRAETAKLGPIAVIYGFKWWINSPMGRRMILGGDDVSDPLDPDTPAPMSADQITANNESYFQFFEPVGGQARGVWGRLSDGELTSDGVLDTFDHYR